MEYKENLGGHFAKGSELIFISLIKRDGSGTILNDNSFDMSRCDDTTFRLSSLSITNGTWIASEFNSYVVKLKNQ